MWLKKADALNVRLARIGYEARQEYVTMQEFIACKDLTTGQGYLEGGCDMSGRTLRFFLL